MLELSEDKKPRRKTRVISARISPRMHDAVMLLISSGLYVDPTDYLRDVIRKDLKERGMGPEQVEQDV